MNNSTHTLSQLPLKGVETPKAITNRLRNYLAGQVVGITRDESLLEEVLKCTYCRVFLERHEGVTSGESIQDPEAAARAYRQAYQRLQHKFPDLFSGNGEILLGPAHIAMVDRELAQLRLSETNCDVIGDIYEAFMGASYKGQAGQFFTPRVAIEALVELVEPQVSDKLIDPACGSGGFLLGATRYMSEAGSVNPANVHGIDKDSYLVHLSQLHLALRFDTVFPISCTDSLIWEGNGFEGTATKALLGKFDLVLTNPPFGSKIVALSEEASKRFDLAYKWRHSRKSQRYEKSTEVARNTPPQVLFIERIISLLTQGGRAGVVVPESLLSSKTYSYAVQYLLDHTKLVAVIGMPESLFKISGKGGTHTKVCLVVFEKGSTPPDHTIFMAEAKWCGHDSRAREIPQNDLPEIVTNFKKFKQGVLEGGSSLGFPVTCSSLQSNVLAPRFYDPGLSQLMGELADSHDFIKIDELIRSNVLSISTGDEVGRSAYGTGNIPFVRTSDISNWEVKVNPKHSVSEEVYNQYKKKQDIQVGDILMVRDGTYLIGTCALISEYDTRIIYQSHLYKIRVNPGAPFDNYLLLAMLSSLLVETQIRAMSFTQDIIDSLGDRIKDLLLPVPKDVVRRQEISTMVRQAIHSRIEARELTRQARQAVVAKV